MYNARENSSSLVPLHLASAIKTPLDLKICNSYPVCHCFLCLVVNLYNCLIHCFGYWWSQIHSWHLWIALENCLPKTLKCQFLSMSSRLRQQAPYVPIAELWSVALQVCGMSNEALTLYTSQVLLSRADNGKNISEVKLMDSQVLKKYIKSTLFLHFCNYCSLFFMTNGQHLYVVCKKKLLENFGVDGLFCYSNLCTY